MRLRFDSNIFALQGCWVAIVSYCLSKNAVHCVFPSRQAAILAKKQHLAAQQSALDEVLKAGVSDGVHPLERPDYSPEVKVGGDCIGSDEQDHYVDTRFATHCVSWNSRV